MLKQFLVKPFIALAVGLFSGTSMAADSFNDDLSEFNHAIWWKSDGWSNGFPFYSRWEGETIVNSPEGMAITLEHAPEAGNDVEFRSGELRSHTYYGYGCFEAEIKPISESGVITSFFLFAGPYDTPEGGNGMHNEIDIEFLGNNTNLLQVNYWTNDDRYENSNEHLIYLDFDASEDFHRYGIKWTKKAIKWYIDGKMVYKVRNKTAATAIPSQADSKLRIMANVWATDNRISNWAGEFDVDSRTTHTAHYRNIRYEKGRKCSFEQ
ncbi:1,3-beta-glucanase [Photobacterium sanctipauli]|uniref:Beta-glucanase n=1 Tax=Photobacterium sanctipauli TaxID=1342794 RepID=A0A2T3NPD0_9GAMM|nr:family 16 glycosylhydrolase [Photobacterium sanctipauli]PSW18134.1 1,3-beta-glucanase [Photobacterium sanctipauli]